MIGCPTDLSKQLKFAVLAVFLSVALFAQSGFPDVTKTVLQARDRGLDLLNPFEVSASTSAEVERLINFTDSPYLRLRKIQRFLNDNGFLSFEYDISATLTAEDTFLQKRGNCLSYTGLFIALNRRVKVPVYFVYDSDALDFEEQGCCYVVSSHIATGFREGPRIAVVDFNHERKSFMVYDRIDDQTAYCYFYNNYAVGRILTGKYEEAEKILSFLLELRPNLKEVQNNMGVLLMKTGRTADALRLYEKMREVQLPYQPAIHNGLLCARILKDKGMEKQFLETLRTVSRNDALKLYQNAMELEMNGRLDEAIKSIRKAVSTQPRNAFLHATLALLYFKSGDIEKGKKSFRRARSLAPHLMILDELLQKYPQFIMKK